MFPTSCFLHWPGPRFRFFLAFQSHYLKRLALRKAGCCRNMSNDPLEQGLSLETADSHSTSESQRMHGNEQHGAVRTWFATSFWILSKSAALYEAAFFPPSSCPFPPRRCRHRALVLRSRHRALVLRLCALCSASAAPGPAPQARAGAPVATTRGRKIPSRERNAKNVLGSARGLRIGGSGVFVFSCSWVAVSGEGGAVRSKIQQVGQG